MARSLRRTPRSLFRTSVRGVALQKKPMYGTRPCCLVQAITRHTYPDPYLGSWNCMPHQAHKWANEQHRPAGFESRLVLDPPPLYPHFDRPSGFWLCVKPRLVGDLGKYRHGKINKYKLYNSPQPCHHVITKLRHKSKRVRTPLASLYSFSDK